MDQSQASTSQHDPHNVLEEINAELVAVAERTDEVRKKLMSLHYWNDPVGNRRVRQQERREHQERRRIVRPDGDRRDVNSDRRLPLETRCQSLRAELDRLTQRNTELLDVSRKLHRA